MDNLMKTEDREISQVKKKNGKANIKKIQQFKKRISDESYIDQAISKIATDLSHFLTK